MTDQSPELAGETGQVGYEAAAVERCRMALAEAGYPDAEVSWSDWMHGPSVVTWRATTGPLVPGDVASKACDLAMQFGGDAAAESGPPVTPAR